MVTSKDLRYLWIGLGCWVGIVVIGIALKLDRRYLIVFPILAGMLVVPAVLILMAYWKRHYFVGNALVVMMMPFVYVFGPAFLPRQSMGSLLIKAGGNLRESVIAMHNYHSDHSQLPPPAITAPDGTPLLSWRVIILSYLGQEELYKEFHLNEAWDSEHNRKLIPRMPDIYKSVGKVNCPEYHTFIQAFVGPGILLDPKRRRALGPITPQIGWNNIPLLAEGGQPVFWTKPEDISFSIEKGIGPIGGQFPVDQSSYPCIHLAMADASVRTLRPSFNLEILCQAIQWKSTKGVEIDWE
jgi:Protein of unknown function (DUF1559)